MAYRSTRWQIPAEGLKTRTKSCDLMKENVLEVLLYLFENYMIEDAEFQPNIDSLTDELSRAGFGNGEIDKAFSWLEDLSLMCEELSPDAHGGSHKSLRHYLAEEQIKIDREARALLLSLEQTGVIGSADRELVIDRVMALDADHVDVDQLKWIIMMVLCSRSQQGSIQSWVEDLVRDGVPAHLH